MDSLIKDHCEEIATLCRDFRVRNLELFGSAAVGPFDPNTSDVDFLVEFQDLRPGEWADTYFGLQEALEALLERPVDLVMPTTLRNPYLIHSINQSRTPLYAA